MLNEFEQNEISIRSVYYCPHLPSITGPCDCRKPKAGLIFQAISDFLIDPEASVLIGDRETDILCAKRARIGLKVLVRDPKQLQSKDTTMADCVVKSIRDGLDKLDGLV